MANKMRIETDNAPASTGHRSNAMIAAGILFTGGHIGGPLGKPGEHLPPAETLEEQVDWCLRHTEQLMIAGGATKERTVEISAFMVPWERRTVVRERTRAFLGFDPPLYHELPVADCAAHAWLEMDGIAVADPCLKVEDVANIMEPFGHGQGLVRSGPLVFINGLTAPGHTLGEQSTNLLREAARQLEGAGSALANLVKLTVFLAEFDIYPEFNEATKVAFASFEPPTRSVLVAPEITGNSLLRVDMVALA